MECKVFQRPGLTVMIGLLFYNPSPADRKSVV